jgi:hypothetical protein
MSQTEPRQAEPRQTESHQTQSSSPAQPSGDLALLRQYEPVLRFTRGEEFYPTDVEWYVRQSSLWVSHANGHRELLLPEGALDLDRLAEERKIERGGVLHLTFSDPLNLAQLSAFLVSEGVRQLRNPRDRFQAMVGRLARVGYVSRFVDALFSLTLLLRGRVSGDSAASALLTCRQRSRADRRFPYYGRVVREGDWIALQYWIFYPFNNWRSGFFGANDHEADWEMLTIFLYQRADETLAPAWVAYAAHDEHGADLRRAWDDTEHLTRNGNHPVVYIGAGSHAAYFQKGEYVAEIEVPYLRLITRPLQRFASLLQQAVRQAGFDGVSASSDLFRIPFVDYARGDGISIGPGQVRVWSPVLIEPAPRWISAFRGLWGYFARDPTAGENAPSGPMYNRNGSVRRAWYDPVGWAGLDGVPTPANEPAAIAQRIDELDLRAEARIDSIGACTAELQALHLEVAAARGRPHLNGRMPAAEARLRSLRANVDRQRREQVQDALVREALVARLDRLADRPADAVTLPDERLAHTQHVARPATDADLRLRRLLEIWAATSIGLVLLGMVTLAISTPDHLVDGAMLMIGVLVVVESIFRRRLARLVSTVAIGLAIVSLGVVAYELVWELIVLGVLAAGLFILVENLRELRH